MALGRAVLVAVVLSVATACGSRSPYMRENNPPQALVPPADAALVVFLRPSKYGSKALFHVIDGEGHFVGDLNGRQYFVSVRPPGRHQFIAWGENTDTVFADLAPGRVYYVLVSVRMGAWSARLTSAAFTARHPEWAHLSEWVANSRQMVPDVAAGEAAQVAEKIQKRLTAARETWERLDPRERELRYLRVEDGFGPPPGTILGPPIGSPPAPGSPPPPPIGTPPPAEGAPPAEQPPPPTEDAAPPEQPPPPPAQPAPPPPT